ncbi:rhodanese-like domain-containing protein [Sulfurimonas lithotrophica]|uniref:Rhodanese-like domain-containing protein n=1 Tax=Sulfurimonas lithotrophica TaxID=2590022 RepID=A0A5P8P1S6_9BACT|nr:rhodanese-like domain-containing protein [Sulfurimonas lithotrophica]QFR49571.1 rhodanese-like domain-containing protein [Sulfurimonas lithotrophica]
MKKIITLLFVLSISIFAELKNEYPTQKLIDSKIPIIDIRTPPEWVETGLVKGAIPIMFFDERARYDIPKFLNTLNKKIDTTKPFALICRTGSRTKILSEFLSSELNYKVINLLGGMVYIKAKGLPIEAYKK